MPAFDKAAAATKQAGVPDARGSAKNMSGTIPVIGGILLSALRGVQLEQFDVDNQCTVMRAGMPVQRIFTRNGGWNAEAPLEKHPVAEKAKQAPLQMIRIDQGDFMSHNEAPATGARLGPLV
nr:hypothetical protein [Paracoccus saliphilus]